MHMKKTVAKVFGWIILIVGVLGFFSNPIIGETGYFRANVAHNVLHVLIGIILLLVAKTEEKAARWLKIMGAVIVLVAILGFLQTPAMATGYILGIFEVNGASNWLHVVLGIVIFLCGMGGKRMAAAPAGAQM